MNITDRIIRHISNPNRRYHVRHYNASSDTWTLETLDGRYKGQASTVHVSPVSYEIFGPDGWAHLASEGTPGGEETPVSASAVDGRVYQFATVDGADAFIAVRDHSYTLGLAWFQACAIAAYTVERYPGASVNVLLGNYSRHKNEAWYGDERAFFWMHFYGQQPSHPRY